MDRVPSYIGGPLKMCKITLMSSSAVVGIAITIPAGKNIRVDD